VELDAIERVERGRNEKPSIKTQEAFETYLGTLTVQKQHTTMRSKVDKLLGSKVDHRTGQRVQVYGFDKEQPFHLLSTPDVQRLVMHRRKEGNSNATILYELVALSQTIKLMSKLGYQVPELDLSVIKRDNDIKPAKHRIRFLSTTEESALLHQLHPTTEVRGVSPDNITQRQDAYDFVVMLLDTGARHSEVSQITWNSIDLQRGVIHLYRPKVRNESILPISNRLMSILQRRQQAKRQDQKHLFESSPGQPRNNCPKALANAAKRSGIEGCSFHTLRHTTASRLIQAGMSLYEVGQVLGHADVKTTAIYAHLVPSQSSQKMMQILNSTHAVQQSAAPTINTYNTTEQRDTAFVEG
jgi:integrase